MIIDISQYNDVYDWDKVKKSVSGVIIRAGYRGYGKRGTLCTDKSFQKYAEAMISRNIPLGVYWVTQAVNTTEILEECIYLHDLIKKEIKGKPDLGVWLDSEPSGHPQNQGRADSLTRNARTDLVNDFCRYFNDQDFNVGLYCSDSWLDDKLVYSRLSSPSYWVARYGKNNGKPGDSPKHYYDIWQYTSKGRVNGIIGDVDLNEKPVTKMLPNIKGYTGHSIAEALRQYGYPNDYNTRKTYAEILGIKGYRGTADQNLEMIKMLGGVIR